MTDYNKLTYDGDKIQVESAVRDEEGYSIKGCYAKKTEIKDGTLTINTNGGSTLGTFSANQSSNQTITLPNGTVQLLNQSVTFVANTDSSTNTEFPYRASVSVTGVKSSTYAEVVYSNDQAESMNYASFVDTDTNVIYIYSRTNVGTVTIPTISIGMDYSDITIDSAPTSGSGNAVSSGGVYTALQGKQNTLTFDTTPTSASMNPVTSGGILTALNGKQSTTSRLAKTGVFYQLLNNKTYLCWGWASINVQYDTRTTISITYPVTPDDGGNVFPVITSISTPSYFGDCVFAISERSSTGFKVQSMGNYNGMGTVAGVISWMAVITTA